MKYVITADEMKRADETTMKVFGVPSCVLMERAALCVRDEIISRTPLTCSVLVVCGTGNNGGDGMALSRMLIQQGYDVDVVVIGNLSRASEEAGRQLKILAAYGIPVLTAIPERTYEWVVDAIFGISLSRPIDGAWREALERMNAMSGRKLAVDISSGVTADTGQILGTAFRADLTVTMAYPKYGQMIYPGKEMTGELIVAEIGITDQSFGDRIPDGSCYDKSDLSRIPPRSANTNKGSYGKLLCITGSENMAGAAYLSAKAAYRTGTGLVYIETPEKNRQILQTLLPEAVLYTYWSGSTAQVREHAAACSAVTAGCGIGTGDDARAVLEMLLRYADRPLVADADALNLIASEARLYALAQAYAGPLILTPHIGEASRLLNLSIPRIKEDPISAARQIAAQFGCICVLKDAATIVSDDQTGRIWFNTTGCNAMAKGGSGDVLAGVIGSLLAQGASAWDAATTGVYLHGLSGEASSAQTGAYSMLASDLTDGIRMVLSGKD